MQTLTRCTVRSVLHRGLIKQARLSPAVLKSCGSVPTPTLLCRDQSSLACWRVPFSAFGTHTVLNNFRSFSARPVDVSDPRCRPTPVAAHASGAASGAADFKPDSGQQNRWRSVIRWALRILASVVLSAALLLAMLPGILSTRRGRESCFSLAKPFVPGTVQVADMQIGWQQPLNVSGLTWTEPQELGGRQLASVDHISTTNALLDIVRGHSPTSSGSSR
ncbi:TPA: hypothetical protein ACH3X1_011265 [Trebouxia sp. C0004]